MGKSDWGIMLGMFIDRMSVAGVFARGLCMGIADLIPGVSGGTIAFITGIYPRLLAAVANFSRPRLYADIFIRRQWRAAWRDYDGAFLAALLGGIVTAILLASRLLHYLLTHYSAFLLSFFFGLIIASILFVARQADGWRARHYAIAVVAAAVTFVIVLLPPAAASEPSLWFLFVGGMIAISAMLLPGISGSYILLIMGLYAPVIAALHERDFVVIIVFAAGCGAGVLCFARALNALLARWRGETLAAILGVMVGALPKLWPIKEPAEGARIILQKNILPAQWVTDETYTMLACALLGVAVVVGLERLGDARR